MAVMTIHVLHVGDGYLYLIRSVAAHDGRLGVGESLAAYYTASGQPPGRWAGAGTMRLGVAGVVTEEQMRLLFGEGMHPNASAIQAALVASGASESEALRATRLGRRFPRYGARDHLSTLARRAYAKHEARLGRSLTDDQKLAARQHAAAVEFESRNGRLPLDPIELHSADAGGREAVAGYDLVFTPVKSVAALWGIGSARTRQQVFEAHQTAVEDALSWLEANAALTRTGNRGQAQIDTQGLTAALFNHWDSRAGDPDLHTHVAISNKVQGPDGKWRSLDGRALFAAAVSASERYNTRIEDELRQRLGVQFVERPGSLEGRRAVREIAGMPLQIIDGFSKRRQGIEQQYQDLLREYRQQHGHEPTDSARHQLYQQATLNARPDKIQGRSLRQMVDSWRREADAILNMPDAAAIVERATLNSSIATEPANPGVIADAVLDVLAASRATWNVHHVRAEAQRQSRRFHATDRDQLVEAVVEAASDPQRVIRIETSRTLPEPPELQRADGESVFVEHGAALFTTIGILDAEERIVAGAKGGTGHVRHPGSRNWRVSIGKAAVDVKPGGYPRRWQARSATAAV
jgi:conjugative relaxase-like TrwC/TraI family protein